MCHCDVVKSVMECGRVGWGGVIPAIGGVSIRQDASPRQGRPGGHCLAPAVTFWKILAILKFLTNAFLNVTTFKFGPFEVTQLLIDEFSHHDSKNLSFS